MRKSGVALINPAPLHSKGIHRGTAYPPLGLVYIATVLKAAGIPVRIIDANILRLGLQEIERLVSGEAPLYIGITCDILTYQNALALAGHLKKNNPSSYIVFGGPHPSSIPQEALKEDCVDFVVIGEGEVTALKLYQALADGQTAAGVEGVAFKQGGEIKVNRERQRMEDLDALPFADMSLLPALGRYTMRSRAKPVGALLTSRGCIHGCVYCNKKIFGRQFRMRSAEHVLAEIDYLVRGFGIRQIDILDDYFNHDLERAKRILQLVIATYGSRLYINFQNGLRVDNVDTEFLDLMKRAGVFKVCFGVESADPQVLRRIRKNLDLERVLPVIRAVQEKGIVVHCNFMFGLPGDTPETMRRTIEFAKAARPDIASFTIAIPFPGTPLYDEIGARGRFLIQTLNGIEHGFYGKKVFYEMDSIRKAEVTAYYKKACLEFYGNPFQAARIFRHVGSFSEFLWLCRGFTDMIGSVLG